MIHTFFSYRHSEKEARLCFEMHSPDSPKSSPRDTEFDYAGKITASGVELITEMSAWVSAEILEQTARVAISLPVGLVQGISRGVTSLPTAQEAHAEIMRMGQFFQTLPFIRDVFPLDLKEITNPDTLRNLTSEPQWINAFKVQGIMDTDQLEESPKADAVFGPEVLLLLLTPSKRKELYLQFVGAYIPPHVQELNKLTPAPGGDAFEALKGKMPVLNTAMTAMLGEQEAVWKDGRTPIEVEEVRKIATTSTQDYYQRADTTGIDKMRTAGTMTEDQIAEMLAKPKNGFIPNNLRTDYRDARKLFPKNTRDTILTDTNQVANKLPLNRLHGALNLGVVGRDDLERMHVGLRREKQIDSMVITDVTGELNKLSGAAKERATEEVKGIMDVFHGMSGIEKLMLVVGGVAALTYSKFARRSAIVLGGAYFFQRLVLKDKDPTQRWSDLVYGITGKVKNVSAGVLGEGVIPGQVADVSTRANSMTNFLSDFDRKDLEQQAVGLSLLADMPMSALANNFQMYGLEGGEGMSLDVSANGELDTQMEAAMKRRGWTDDYRKFFENPKNQTEVAEAMSYVFYSKAAENTSNDARVKLIRETLGREMPGRSIVDFSKYILTEGPSIQDVRMNANIHAAYEAYVYMVSEGKEESKADNMTLGNFVKSRAFVEGPIVSLPYQPEGKKVAVAPISGTPVTVAAIWQVPLS